MLISCKILTCPCICWSNTIGACKILTSPCICWSPLIGGQWSGRGFLQGLHWIFAKKTHHVASSGHVASFMSGSLFMSCSSPLPAIQCSQVRATKKLGASSHTQVPSDLPNPVQGSCPRREPLPLPVLTLSTHVGFKNPCHA